MKDLPERAQSKETEQDVKWLLWKKAKKKPQNPRTKQTCLYSLSLYWANRGCDYPIFASYNESGHVCHYAVPFVFINLYFGNVLMSRCLLFGWMVMGIHQTFDCSEGEHVVIRK